MHDDRTSVVTSVKAATLADECEKVCVWEWPVANKIIEFGEIGLDMHRVLKLAVFCKAGTLALTRSAAHSVCDLISVSVFAVLTIGLPNRDDS